ncbi:9143_t:CDS:1, partial [Dentiscutata erythropus]
SGKFLKDNLVFDIKRFGFFANKFFRVENDVARLATSEGVSNVASGVFGNTTIKQTII